MLSIWLTLACNTPEPVEVPPVPKSAVQPEANDVGTAAVEKKKDTSTKTPAPVVTGSKPFISEVMLNPSMVEKFRGDWIELYNPTDTVIDLSNYSIHSKDDAGIRFTSKHQIDPHSTFLMAVRKSATGNGGLPPVDYVYKHDVLKILATDWVELRNGEDVVDRWELTRKDSKKGYSLQRNPDGTTCPSTETYGQGDFGTPKTITLCN